MMAIKMRLKCTDCGDWHDIPADKLDDYNIYWKGDARGVGSMAPHLLCPKCTRKWHRLSKQAMKDCKP